MQRHKSDDGFRASAFPLDTNKGRRKRAEQGVMRVSTVLNGTNIAIRRVTVPNSE